MVEISEKVDTSREAVAVGSIFMKRETLGRIKEDSIKKRGCTFCGSDWRNYGLKEYAVHYSNVPYYYYHQ